MFRVRLLCLVCGEEALIAAEGEARECAVYLHVPRGALQGWCGSHLQPALELA